VTLLAFAAAAPGRAAVDRLPAGRQQQIRRTLLQR